MELGIYTFAELRPDPVSGRAIDPVPGTEVARRAPSSAAT